MILCRINKRVYLYLFEHANKENMFTVCFNSFVTFYDGITLEVIKIIQFWKKPFIDNSLAFNTKQFSRIFYRSLILFTPWGALGQIMQKRLFFSFFFQQITSIDNFICIFINYNRISLIWNLSGMKIMKFCKKKRVKAEQKTSGEVIVKTT